MQKVLYGKPTHTPNTHTDVKTNPRTNYLSLSLSPSASTDHLKSLKKTTDGHRPKNRIIY